MVPSNGYIKWFHQIVYQMISPYAADPMLVSSSSCRAKFIQLASKQLMIANYLMV